MPLSQLNKEEVEQDPSLKQETPQKEDVVESTSPDKKKKGGLFATMRSLTNMVMNTGKQKDKDKEKEREKAEEETYVLATRFIAFEAGCTIVLQYLPTRPSRDFGPFTSMPNEKARPIPDIQWDSQILQAYRLESLKQIHLVNYQLIEQLDDPDENLVTIRMTFAEPEIDHVPIVVEGRL